MRYEIDHNGCWNFTGNLDDKGYGRVKYKDKEVSAHRMIAHICIKPLMSKMDVVAHRCDNPRCINPEHLFITTHAGNSLDMVQKGRQCRGEEHRLSKLTLSQVREIRARYQSGESMGKLGPEYGVTYNCIQAIIRGRTWRESA